MNIRMGTMDRGNNFTPTHLVAPVICDCGEDMELMSGTQVHHYVRGTHECSCGNKLQLTYMPAVLE